VKLAKKLFRAIRKYRGHKPNHFRVTSKGLFLKEHNLDFIAQLYCQTLNLNNKKKTSAAGALERILELSEDELHYFIEPGLLWTGYVIPVGNKGIEGIPASDGEVVSCRNHLDHRDIGFQGHDNMTVHAEGEYVAEFRPSKTEKYNVPWRTFSSFVDLARRSNPDEFAYLRDCLLEMYQFVRKSEPFDHDFLNSQKNKTYRRRRRWLFEIQNNVIMLCTEIPEQYRHKKTGA